MEVTKPFTEISPRHLAHLFTNASLQKLNSDVNTVTAYGQLLKFQLKRLGVSGLNKSVTVGELLEQTYNYLLCNYKSEYIYKVDLFSRYLYDTSLEDSITILSELTIAKSKADVVSINGTGKVYEIKTELDKPERLNSQLQDYLKAFSEVSVVIHENDINKYERVIEPYIGILTYDGNGFASYRAPIKNHAFLDRKTMLDCLRKDEVSSLIKEYFGFLPEVPPVYFRRAINELAFDIQIDILQRLFFDKLKMRTFAGLSQYSLDKIPSYLRFFFTLQKGATKKAFDMLLIKI